MTTQAASHPYVLDFADITLGDLARVGGKNASLGELFAALKPKGVGVLDGFATTADAYWRLLKSGDLEARLHKIFSTLDAEDLTQLSRAGEAARAAVLETVRDTRELESTINDIFDGGELEGFAELAAAATEEKDKEPEKDAAPATIEEAKTTLIVKRPSTRRKKPAGESTPDEGDKGFGPARAREA